MSLSRKRSLVWDYFDLLHHDQKVVCTLDKCKQQYAYSKSTKGSTASMKNHLKNAHKIDVTMMEEIVSGPSTHKVSYQFHNFLVISKQKLVFWR